MATGQISATFDIVLSGDMTAPGANFTASRAFRVVSIESTSTAAGASTLDLTFAGTASTATATGVSGQGVVQARAALGPCAPVGVLPANASCAAGAAVIATAGAATVTQIVLSCIANPATAIPVS